LESFALTPEKDFKKFQKDLFAFLFTTSSRIEADKIRKDYAPVISFLTELAKIANPSDRVQLLEKKYPELEKVGSLIIS
jgi:hypothetical protein